MEKVQVTVPDEEASAGASVWPIVLRIPPVLKLTEDQYFELCGLNRELHIERNSEGELLIMTPPGWETGRRNLEITMQLGVWAKRDGTGVATGSSAGFTLPNGATREPDAAWISRARLAGITAERREKFLPACPDFVVELRSPSDRLRVLQDKMAEYLANGAGLGWLLDPRPRRVYVYRPGVPVEVLQNPPTLAGNPVLPGFVLDLSEVW